MEKNNNIPASLQFDGYEEQKAEFMAKNPDAPQSSPIEVLDLVLRRV